jgi:Tfp pilus assembly protein PilF
MKPEILLVLLLLSCSPGREAAPLAGPKEEQNKSWTDLGLEYVKRGEHAQALSFFERAKTEDPQNALHWNNVCSQKVELQRYFEAEQDCRRALQLNPKFELAVSNLKWIDTQKMRMKNEIKSRNAEVKRHSSKSTERDILMVELGLAHYRLGEYSLARMNWLKIPEQSPHYVTALNNLASASILMGDFHRAEKELKEALAVEPSNSQVIRNWAWFEEAKKSKK